MSIYGNLFINESNTFSLESLDNLLEEDINFETMFNEACSINILTEAIDMKSIKEKLKNVWNKILNKIKELIEKIKEFIKYIKNEIIGKFIDNIRKKIEEAKNKKKTTSDTNTTPNNESYFLLEDANFEPFKVVNLEYFITNLDNKFTKILLNSKFKEFEFKLTNKIMTKKYDVDLEEEIDDMLKELDESLATAIEEYNKKEGDFCYSVENYNDLEKIVNVYSKYDVKTFNKLLNNSEYIIEKLYKNKEIFSKKLEELEKEIFEDVTSLDDLNKDNRLSSKGAKKAQRLSEKKKELTCLIKYINASIVSCSTLTSVFRRMQNDILIDYNKIAKIYCQYKK